VVISHNNNKDDVCKNYVFMDLMRPPIEYSIVKNAVMFWYKIARKPKTSVLWNCFLALQSEICNNKTKYNWVKELQNTLSRYDVSIDLNLNTDEGVNQNLLVKSL